MEKSLQCLTHPAALLPAMDLLIDLDRLLRAFRRTIHILHLLLDQVHLPIELVEHNMEGVKHTLVSVDLDQTGLELLLVTVVPTMLVCSVSLAREEESIERFHLERESVQNILWFGVDSSTRHCLLNLAHVRRQMRLHLRLLSHIEHLSMEFMDLSSACRLLRELLLP